MRFPGEQFHRFEPASKFAPDKLFDQRWAMTLLEAAISQLRTEIAASGKAEQFERLKTFLTEDPRDGEYAEVAAKLGCTSQSLAVAVHRIRQHYRELVRGEAGHTVSSPMEMEEEMRHLCDMNMSCAVYKPGN